MKSRSSREKDIAFSKSRLLENNYQTARDNENNSKLANLLNLSEFNCRDGINQKTAAFVAGINHKLLKSRKSPLLDISRNLGNLGHDNEQAKEDRDQAESDKGCKNSKTKRSKSQKRHVLSCNQILNIVKKRETFSMMSLQNSKASLMTNYGTMKQKKKVRKQQMHMVKPTNKSKMMPIPMPVSLNNSKGIFGKQQISGNFVANYPLSMSHSYIVFSEKDSSLNNTTTILSKMSKKISGQENKVLELQEKLEGIKREHAAIIIQKNWRGFLTRKLLQDYILSEEAKLINKLTNLKFQREEYERFEKQSPGCNRHWSHHQCLEFQDIFTNSQRASKKESLGDQLKMISPVNSNSRRSLHMIEEYPKKVPVINEQLDSDQIIESLLQQKQSPSLTSRSKVLNNFQDEGDQDSPSIQVPLCQDPRKSPIYKIIPVLSLAVTPMSQNNSHPVESKQSVGSMLSDVESKILNAFNQLLEDRKKKLNEEVKKCQIGFDEMLHMRDQVKKWKYDVENQTKLFCSSLLAIQQQLAGSPKTEHQSAHKQGSEQQQSEDNQTQILSFINKKSLLRLPKQAEQQQQSEKGSGSQSSPISEYFTIELPTQELSPFKPSVSSGLESLKIYLENLHQEMTQEGETNQTSFICSILKKHSEIGPENMIERCLIQMLVEMLTDQFQLHELMGAVEYLETGQGEQDLREECLVFVRGWADELEKWELGPIEEVSGNMEQSANITERNNNSQTKC